MITCTDGVLHTRTGKFILEEPRQRMKAAGFRFHWEVGSSKCIKPCAGCSLGLPPKTWFSTNWVAAGAVSDLFDETAIKAVEDMARREQESRDEASNFDVPVPDGLDLFPFQKAAVAYAMQRKRVLFADAMGLGKTLQAIGWINTLRNEVGKILVVCPASLKLNWLREMNKWLWPDGKLMVPWIVVGLDQEKEDIHKILYGGVNVVIVNYEVLVQCEPLVAELMSIDWGMLIIDEAHRVKTHGAQRSQVILGTSANKKQKKEAKPGLVHKAERIALLTGTPIPNRPREFYSIAQLMDPETFGNEWRYLQRYCGPTKRPFWKKDENGTPQENFAWDFSGASNLAELRDLCRSSFMVRRLKKDVWKEMPEKIRQIIPFDSTDVIRQLDGDISTKLLQGSLDFVQGANTLEDADLETLRLEEIEKEREQLGRLKVPLAIDFLKMALEGSRKVVAFCHHHHVVERIHAAFKKESVVLYGPTPEAKRQEAVDRFQSDKDVRLFIGTGAAGEGITLTASSHVVFVEGSWGPADIDQREDRVHRIGQVNRVLIQHLVWDGTIEARIIKKIVEKQRTIEKALDR